LWGKGEEQMIRKGTKWKRKIQNDKMEQWRLFILNTKPHFFSSSRHLSITSLLLFSSSSFFARFYLSSSRFLFVCHHFKLNQPRGKVRKKSFKERYKIEVGIAAD
jgi:hypothetical protein